MKIQVDEEGRKAIESLVSAGMKSLDHNSVIGLARMLQSIETIVDNDPKVNNGN